MKKKLKAGCIVISKDNPQNILLIKANYKDGFSFPKGHLEDGETLEECAIRETREETGINVNILKNLGLLEHPDYYCDELGEILFYLAESLSDQIDKILKTDNSTTVLWKNYKEILDLDIINDYKNFYIEHFSEIEEYIFSKQH